MLSPQGNNPPRAVARLNQELNLTSDQQKQVAEYSPTCKPVITAFASRRIRSTSSIRRQGREQIRQLLTPEQQPKFESYLQRLDQERRERDKQNR